MKRASSIVRMGSIYGLLLAAAAICRADTPSPAAAAGFDRCVSAVQARIAQQHGSALSFLPGIDPERAARLRQGQIVVERLTPEGGEPLPGALLHHWRGTAFIPGATAADFEETLRNFAAYPRVFAPQVLAARWLSGDGDRFRIQMRVRQQHVIAVTLDGTYDVRFGRLDAEHGWSTSQSTQMDEIGDDGQPLSPQAQHGFLWRLDTWWTFEQRDGGLYVQIETVSLTRSIPAGLGWVVGPFVENIPRESLEFTLRRACAAVSRPARPGATRQGGMQ